MSGAGTFDFCAAMERLCIDICSRHAEFLHVRMSEVVVTFAQTRSSVDWGMQAKLTPLRFEGGRRTERRNGRVWTIHPIRHNGKEALYVLTFYLPRFLNLSFDEKIITVFHELYHISPLFDGDIRRFKGACYMHSGSQKAYDKQMAVFAKEYLASRPDRSLYTFLNHDFINLQKSFGAVVGLRIQTPRLVEVRDAA
ncbi:MAG: hypothetical protein KDA91_12185 [Planctomycetaceae bacterium]|nr:hypothetical protein [Planctomycetaceae bacterium]